MSESAVEIFGIACALAGVVVGWCIGALPFLASRRSRDAQHSADPRKP